MSSKILPAGERNAVRLAADANVLLAAVIGGRARLLLRHPEIQEILTTESTFAEVEEYAPFLARKKRISSDILLLAMAALPVTIVGPSKYSKSMAEAIKRIAGRDPDDVHLLALALHSHVPIWSNDHDFEDTGIKVFTTEGLLRRLGLIE